ncbi:MAG: hypothetical protein K6G31_13030 [Paludibacteraceae bacterium]|nr:hypothetical protein [Paludibacteraceae bacterium]
MNLKILLKKIELTLLVAVELTSIPITCGLLFLGYFLLPGKLDLLDLPFAIIFIIHFILYIPLSFYIVFLLWSFFEKSINKQIDEYRGLRVAPIEYKMALVWLASGDEKLLENVFGKGEAEWFLKHYEGSRIDKVAAPIRLLSQQKKQEFVRELFAIAVKDDVVSDSEWNMLQTLMKLVELNADVVEGINKEYSPYRAIFPDMSEKSTAVQAVQPDSHKIMEGSEQ